jgi:hypothetical protein
MNLIASCIKPIAVNKNIMNVGKTIIYFQKVQGLVDK